MTDPMLFLYKKNDKMRFFGHSFKDQLTPIFFPNPSLNARNKFYQAEQRQMERI